MSNIRNFKVIIEQDEDGLFVASVSSVPGCHTQGNTYEQALKNIKDALLLCLKVAQEDPSYKRKIVYPSKPKQEQFLGVVDLPISLAY